MEINENSINQELQQIQQEEQNQENQKKELQEQEIRENTSFNEFYPYINTLHNLILNKYLHLDVEEELLQELNQVGLKLLEKYIPKAEIMGKYSLELSYFSLIMACYLKKQQNEKTQPN
jgi:Rad3-related DNA helicase